MKVRECLGLCCLLLSTCVLSLSAGQCQDYEETECKVEKCDRNGYSTYCKKTCGRCGPETTVSPRQRREQCAERYSGRCRVCEVSGLCDTCEPCFEGSSCTGVSRKCKCNRDNICKCNPGFYGTGCNQECSANCLNKTCESNGTCTHGCNTGWHGVRCHNCSEHCVNDKCISGSCSLGCDTEWFGRSCDQPCPGHCRSGSCDRLDGSCTSCLDGYTGSHCNVTCPQYCAGHKCDQTYGACQGCEVGWFGRPCNSSCPENCAGETCDQRDGACLICGVGWFGRHCKSACPNKCAGETCYQTNGGCSACKAHWFGRHCNNACPENCEAETCVQIDGVCSSCKAHWFGRHCNNSCPANCEAETCGQIDGACSSCKVGWFGRHCNSSCPENCAGETCDQTDGACTLGCEAGWFGDDCWSPCPAECESCTREDGRCSSAGVRGIVTWVVLPVLVITLLLIVCVLLVARANRKERFKLCDNLRHYLGIKDTIQISGFNPGSPEGTPPLYGDKVRLLSMRPSQRRTGKAHFQTYPNTHQDFSSPPPLQFPSPPVHDPLQHPSPPPLHSEPPSVAEGPEACHVIPEAQLGCVAPTEVRLAVFKDYVDAMKLNLGLSNQFYDLPFGKLGPCQEAEKPSNAFKNRYRNILPYDHSRVKLESREHIPDSDYINANYIHGYGTCQSFVATQGPYDDVMWDFWRMIWELNCGKIVMLTNLVEARKVKCQQYWPELGEKTDNDGVLVQSMSQTKLPDYTVRTFAVQMKGQQLRTVQQFHYTTWPDKGVPRDVMSLVDFHQSVKQAPTSQSGPIIVHCSAGVGRTGTYIALDYLVAQARAEGAVDVFECVTRLRHQRMDLIQTEDQYTFLHEALLEALPSGDRASPGITGSNTGLIWSDTGLMGVAGSNIGATDEIEYPSGSIHTYEIVEEASRLPTSSDRNWKRPLPDVPQEDCVPDMFNIHQ